MCGKAIFNASFKVLMSKVYQLKLHDNTLRHFKKLFMCFLLFSPVARFLSNLIFTFITAVSYLKFDLGLEKTCKYFYSFWTSLRQEFLAK